MFEPLDAPPHVAALRLTGVVTGADIAAYRAMLAERLDHDGGVSLYLDARGLSELGEGALAEGFGADIDFVRHLGRFRRVAIVADRDWYSAFIAAVAHLLPHVDLRGFRAGEAQTAWDWAVAPPPPPAPGATVRLIPTTDDAVLAFEVDGAVSAEAVAPLLDAIEAALARREKVRVLARVRRLDGVDVATLFDRGVLGMKLRALRQTERYALVGAPHWARRLVETLDPAFPTMAMRAFDAADEAAAWDWVGARPA